MSEHPWPRRVEKALALLSTQWRSFDEVFTPATALEAKQTTGALVWLRNRRQVQSRMTKAGVMQWRKR